MQHHRLSIVPTNSPLPGRVCAVAGTNHGAANVIVLQDGLDNTRSGLSYARELIKLQLRSLMNQSASDNWISYWNSSALLTRIAQTAPCVLKKIYRPYLTNRLDCNGRFAVLKAHYDVMCQQGWAGLVLQAATAPVLLAEFSGKAGTPYQIQLIAVTEMEREGELVLQFVSGSDVLCSVAFTLLSQAGVLSVAIGCLQGGRVADTKDKIRLATRDMFGLRPKTLMVRLVQQLGVHMGCQDLQLVGNVNRVVHHQLRKKMVFADYDVTWQELGAIQQIHGDYVLPCEVLNEPDLQAIASSKRSEAKKRYALLKSVADAVIVALATSTHAATAESFHHAVSADRGIVVLNGKKNQTGKSVWRNFMVKNSRQAMSYVAENMFILGGLQLYLIMWPLS